VLFCFSFVQTIIHELGHLVFGVLSGYHFLSYRIGNLMLVKKNGKFYIKKMSLVGTGGQCIMIPPDLCEGKFRWLLPTLGGIIFNLLISIICFILLFIVNNLYIRQALVIMILIGIFMIIINGVPISLEINNDGYNALLLRKNQKAQYAFWLQLKINEQIFLGKKLKDMPNEWFFLDDKVSDNPIINTINVFNCNRLIEMMKFQEAYNEMDKLLSGDYNIVLVYQYLMTLECIYCELIGYGNNRYLDKYFDKDLQRFISRMKNFPTVLRVQYSYALLFEKNSVKADEIKNKFEKIALKYPYSSDIITERSLMDYVNTIYK